MSMFEKVMLKEKKIMIHTKVKLLRLTRTTEAGRTVGTTGTMFSDMPIQLYSTAYIV